MTRTQDRPRVSAMTFEENFPAVATAAHLVFFLHSSVHLLALLFL